MCVLWPRFRLFISRDRIFGICIYRWMFDGRYIDVNEFIEHYSSVEWSRRIVLSATYLHYIYICVSSPENNIDEYLYIDISLILHRISRLIDVHCRKTDLCIIQCIKIRGFYQTKKKLVSFYACFMSSLISLDLNFDCQIEWRDDSIGKRIFKHLDGWSN